MASSMRLTPAQASRSLLDPPSLRGHRAVCTWITPSRLIDTPLPPPPPPIVLNSSAGVPFDICLATQGWSTGATIANAAPVATATAGSAPSVTPLLEEPLELLWSGDDDVAHGNHSHQKYPVHVLIKCAAQSLILCNVPLSPTPCQVVLAADALFARACWLCLGSWHAAT